MRAARRTIATAMSLAVGFAAVALLVAAPGAGALVPRPEPTPTIPDVIPDVEPSPTPTPTEPPGGGNGGGGGGGNGGGGGDKDPSPSPGEGRPKHGKRQGPKVFQWTGRGGLYSTDELLGVALELRALGWSSRAVMRAVYPPFIIAGRASWTDSWGAPRIGPGPLVRKHRGQDVFCAFGAPVLAATKGVIEFGTDRLGGRVARLYRPDGSYFYYAHLAAWNERAFSSGDKVRPGDVIGYCGNTGNAHGTLPHVHFGWYSKKNGSALDPLDLLSRWLNRAERHARRALEDARAARVAALDRLTALRRFGDAFVPGSADALPARLADALDELTPSTDPLAEALARMTAPAASH